jgi:nucleoside-diphosphate-sugar epimerase
MNILVTGASGFTGGHLARKLISEGHSVRTILRKGSSLDKDLQENLEVFEGDLLDAEVAAAAVKDAEAVYHIAALYRSEGVPEKYFYDVNVEGTRNIMEACCKHAVPRTVHCSTVGVHGHLDNPPAGEDAPFKPGDTYQRSKLDGELLVADEYIKQRKLPVSIFRPTGIYGPGDTRLLKFFRIVKKGHPILGNGKPHYHLTHIDDLVNGIILCGTHPDALGETFILGGPAAPTLEEWYNVIAEVLDVSPLKFKLPVWPFLALGAACEVAFKPFGKEPPVHRRSVHFFTHDRAFIIDKAKELIGYNPEISLEKGMQLTAKWYADEGLL